MEEAPQHRGRSRVWPHLRAALVALHVLAVAVLAAPAPVGAMNRESWKEETVQDEIEVWAGRFGMSPEDFEDWAWSAASRFMAVRDAVVKPFKPYCKYTGTSQSWRMFVAPHRYPARLHIDVQIGREWQTVYVRGDREHAWKRPQLDHNRMRAQIFRLSWPGYGRTYSHFTVWLAREAARDFPDARGIRVRFFRYRTRSPAEVRAGVPEEGHFVQEKVRSLAGYR